jgi:hypothetical protein
MSDIPTLSDLPDDEQDEFYEMADAFVDLANEMAETERVSRVSSAFLYACARYNAYAMQVQGGAVAEADEDAIRYLLEQYEKMLREHMTERLFETNG